MADRIDTMTHDELKAATRKLIEECGDAGRCPRCDFSALRKALAPFDPTPAEIACKVLEDAGFVKTQCGDLCHAIVIPDSASRNVYYKLQDKA